MSKERELLGLVIKHNGNICLGNVCEWAKKLGVDYPDGIDNMLADILGRDYYSILSSELKRRAQRALDEMD